MTEWGDIRVTRERERRKVKGGIGRAASWPQASRLILILMADWGHAGLAVGAHGNDGVAAMCDGYADGQEWGSQPARAKA